MKEKKVKLIYGLGNEGDEFKNTRHNIGKDLIDFYLKDKKNLKYSYYDYFDNLILASNRGYMNESGRGLKELLDKFNLKTENVLVIHDEADIIFPYFKFSFGKKSAGHKGVDSIFKNLKTFNFWRMRIGIQRKKRLKASFIILDKWEKKELIIVEKMKKAFKIILEKLRLYLPNELNLPKDYFLTIDEKIN